MPLNLLVIENDKSAAALMTQVFNTFGATVQIASNAAAASHLARQAKFDGIFLELGLADMNGIDLTQRIRQSSWNTRTPIVLVSRNADAHAAARAFQAGGTFFLPKSLNHNAIRKAFLSTRPVMFDECQRYTRISVASPVQCFLGARELRGCVARNISSGGILFEEDGTLHPSDNVRLLFELEERSLPIVARAQVVWADEKRRAGVNFTAMSHEDRLQIRKRIAARVGHL